MDARYRTNSRSERPKCAATFASPAGRKPIRRSTSSISSPWLTSARASCSSTSSRSIWLTSGSHWRSDERAQGRQVLPVRLVLDRLRRLQQFGQAGEAGVVEEHAEGFQADLSLTDVLVAGDAGAGPFLRAVEVGGARLVGADEARDLRRQAPRACAGKDG